MDKLARGQNLNHGGGSHLVAVLGQLFLCVAGLFAFLGAGAQAGNPNPDWVLVFQDDFSSSSFEGKKLKWGHKWNKIEYMSRPAPDWRKHQSRENALVVPGKEKRQASCA